MFSLVNLLAMAGWLLLIFAGKTRWAAPVISGVILPLLVAVVYSGLLAGHLAGSAGSFQTLAGVSALFENRWLLLAGWVHYLAFDLFIGAWQVRDARVQGISHLLVIPCLLLTFLFGPAGLLLYFLIRCFVGRTSWSAADVGPDRRHTIQNVPET
ncbi:MAG TPA: ABA4-like family protein [Bryobacteraceae bacterium]